MKRRATLRIPRRAIGTVGALIVILVGILTPDGVPSIAPIPQDAEVSTQEYTFVPSADTSVSASRRTTIFGTQSKLEVDADSVKITYLKFDVQGLGGLVTSAKLRLYSEGSSPSGGYIATTGTSWAEMEMTYNNRPTDFGPTLSRLGTVGTGGWYELDVTPAIAGNGLVSLGIRSDDPDGADYSSREGANAPQLVITVVSSSPTPTLKALVEDVVGATGYRYAAKDDRGHSLDTLKIIDNPRGGYLGVYHVLSAGQFSVYLATSTDLLNWTYRVTLDDYASQPTLVRLSDGGFLLADEADRGDGQGAHLRFTHYASPDTLLAGTSDAQFDAPRSLSACAEGTPTVYSATLSPDIYNSTIDVGFHYFRDCEVDRQARGTLTNFGQWAARVEADLNAPLERTWAGNIGDRDTMAYGEALFAVLETQKAKGDWASWRVQLYDWQAKAYTPLAPRTHGGSVAFANPTFTSVVSPGGRRAVVVTYTLPAEGAAAGEAGALIFYQELARELANRDRATPAAPAAAGAATTLVAVGDIAHCPSSGDEATAALLDGIEGTVVTLGDNVYDYGTAEEFAKCYDPSWGRHKGRTRPSPGNHDYRTSGATGYYGYFGAAAGDPDKGYYSYDLSQRWHAIALNSNCDDVGGCAAGSPQYQWLRQDLEAHRAMNVVAYWHHPRWSSGEHGSTRMDAIWDLLYDFGADIVLAGHDHTYERFAPMDKDGHRDDGRGIRSFVVGTGGKNLYKFIDILPTSDVRDNSTFGVLKLSLYPDRYEWQFVPVAGKSFTDSGSWPVH